MPPQPSSRKAAAAVVPAPRPSLREGHRRLTEERIVAAGHDCFLEQSYVGTTMDDIARRASVSRTTLYQHFTGKVQILEMLIQKEFDLFSAAFGDQAGRTVSSRAEVTKVLKAILDYYKRESSFLNMIRSAAGVEESTAALLEKGLRRTVAFVSGLFPEQQRKASQAAARQFTRAWICVSAVDNLFLRLTDPEWALDEGIALRELIDLWCDQFGLSPKA